MTAAVECQSCGYQWTLDNDAVREAARTSVFPDCCQCGSSEVQLMGAPRREER